MDLSVSIVGGHFHTDLYKKDTAVAQYLLPSSCHPSHITKNIPYSLAYRLKRICSSGDQFELRLQELKMDLTSRRYKAKIIDQAFARVRAIPREEALKKVVKKSNDRVILALEYHPLLPSVSKLVKKYWRVMVSQNMALLKAFPNPPLVAYRRGKSLGDELIRAKVNSRRTSSRTSNGYKPCGRSCQCCWHSVRATEHSCPRTGQTWAINNPIDCNTSGVIYKIFCAKCRDWHYIGETGRPLCKRFAEHKASVGHFKGRSVATGHETVAEHFNLPGHSVADMRIMGIERVMSSNPNMRKIREKIWIYRYDSVTYGGNTRDY